MPDGDDEPFHRVLRDFQPLVDQRPRV